MKIKNKRGYTFDLKEVRQELSQIEVIYNQEHDTELAMRRYENWCGMYAEEILDALEAALSVPFNYDEDADHYAEPWVDGHCAALEAVHKAAGLVNED